VDECGLQETIQREYARSPKGKRIFDEKTGNRTSRTSIIAGLYRGEPIAPFYFKGYCNTEVVLVWVKEVLLPCLKQGMTVIWDNASFHNNSQFRQLIESVGCKLLYLPTYSPDLNPIEPWWGVLKSWIRRIRQPEMTLEQAINLILGKLKN
jgi:putative transposase